MSITEMARALGIDKATVSRNAKRGMDMHSISAANAWREIHAPPRNRGRNKTTPSPIIATASAMPIAGPSTATGDDHPEESLRRAREAEKEGYRGLQVAQRSGASLDELRKANAIYVSCRNNRFKAEKDFSEWQRNERITLFYDEAIEAASHVHNAAKNMLDGMAKTLAPRIHNQSQKSITDTLANWADTLCEVLRKSL